MIMLGSPGILGMLYLQGMLSTVTTPDDALGMLPMSYLDKQK